MTTAAPLTFQPVICLVCKGPFVLMSAVAKDEYEKTGEAYCPRCACYRHCQRGVTKDQ